MATFTFDVWKVIFLFADRRGAGGIVTGFELNVNPTKDHLGSASRVTLNIFYFAGGTPMWPENEGIK
jgi:hypothetical protein